MKTISDRLKDLRIEAGYETATDAAKAFGWNENSYRSNENGQRPPGRKTAVKYAKAYRVSVDWLLTGRGPKRPAQTTALRQVPIIRWSDIEGANHSLRAQLLTADAWGFVVVPESESMSSDAFALEVQDDSMVDPDGSPFSLFPGDRVIIDPDRRPKPGSTVLARDGRKVVVRKLRVLRESDDGAPALIALIPLNPDHSTREVPGEKPVGRHGWALPPNDRLTRKPHLSP